MKTKLLLIMMTLTVSSCLNSQSYSNLWNDVNKNLENRLPKSAEESLDKIEQIAIKTNNPKELLRAYLYRFKIIALQDENPIEAAIKFAEENISNLKEPEKSVFNLAIASLYENYLNENRYSIRKNLPVLNSQQSISMKFWDEATFKRVINQYQENALSDIEMLKDTPIESYREILAEGNKSENIESDIEPTLYDYVVHKIINQKDDEAYQQVLELYQDLIDFDKSKDYTDATIYNEIHKLELEYSISNDFDSYFNSLEEIKKEIIGNPLVTSVMALQARAILSQQTTGNVQHPKAKSLSICDDAIKLFPNSTGAKQCESIRSEILEKKLSFSMQNTVLPNQAIPAWISYNNLTNPHYRIYKLSQDELEEIDRLSKKEIVKALLQKDYIIENHVDIPEEKDYQSHSSLIALPELECGSYFIMFSKDDISTADNELPAVHSFQVSKLSFVTTKENNDFMVYVLDRETGNAVEDVNVNIYKQTYNYPQRKYVKTTIANLTTDKNGIAKISNAGDNSFHIDLFKGDDKLLSDAYFYDYQDEINYRLAERTTFFTDRAIYRPGQTVYYKGIVLNQNSKTKKLVVGKETKIVFRDSNWQEVATQTFTTNEFGSFDGSFVIPNNLANGYFCISNESGDIRFKVEEYKRPTFEITFNEPDKSFKLNEEIDLSGSVKAYAGFGLDNVNYNYTIVRRSYFPYRYWWFSNYDSNEKQIAFGDGTTDSKGDFNISFRLIPDENDRDKLPVFEYVVTVNATNAQGETQTKTYTLKASEIDLIIDINNTEKNISENNLKSLTFDVKNLKEKPVMAKVIRKIYKIEDNDKFIKNDFAVDRKLLSDEDLDRLFPNFDYYSKETSHIASEDNRILIYEDVIKVDGQAKLFPDVKNLINEGRYVVELISADNELATTSAELNIIDFNNDKMPFKDLCLSYYDKESAQPGETVNFYLGSSAKDVSAYVMIKHGDKLRYSTCETISGNVLKVPYKVKEDDRGNISFQAFFVKYNTVNIVQHNISVPYDNLKLDIRLDVERDDLLPGEEEKWNLTVKDSDNDGVVANVLASMYDASLDVFAKNDWHFNTAPNIIIPTKPRSDNSFDNFGCFADNQYYRYYDLFDYYLLSDISLTPSFLRYGGKMLTRNMAAMPHLAASKAGGVEETAYDFTIADDALSEESVEAESFNQSNSVQNAESQEMSIRENFNETAFFYPNLKSNDDGSLTFSFSMPDALTRWNLMMLAYTKDLKVGMMNKTFTTSKPLMIMSDMPRFCYENDTLWIVANVIKTTSRDVTPVASTAKLEIFDALTMQPLNMILSEQEIKIDDIAAGESRAVRWKVAVNSDNTNLLAMRFSVKTDDFSDAEQHLLPILSTEVFMTETYPLTVSADTEKTYDFDFSNGNERNQGLTLNFCANPVWYAIQALPYLSQETGEHADVAFNIFYANSLASYIANNIPNLLNYIKKWQIETPDVLVSQLQKDENLKAIMLQETPWVLEAKSETEQKSRIANLFDVNAISGKTDETLNLIKEKQSVNGGWSWMPNMPESPSITQYILSGFGRLYNMNVIKSLTQSQQDKADAISKNAVNYLSNNIIESYNKNKELKKSRISSFVINELYALSFFDFSESSKYKTAKEFFIEKLENDWRYLDFETQATSALVLYREGKNDVAKLIIKSLKERLSQLQNTTDVSAQTLVMEAFKEINPDVQILDELMIGLLNNKRTNMWENARSSVDAIYAIVETTNNGQQTMVNSQQIMVNDHSILINVNGQQSTDNSQESVFFQKYWNAEEMSGINSLKVENNSGNMVWGGLFRQYFVSIDEVRKHKSPLNVERELFVERVNEDGAYLVPIEDTEINVGDKIVVNLTFEASQDMEFVFLKDLRAACLEPADQMSRYKYSDGMSYYQSNSDTFMGFYFDNVTKGVHKVSYSMFVTKEGDFSNGYALIQCMYAPEFSAYSEGMRIRV